MEHTFGDLKESHADEQKLHQNIRPLLPPQYQPYHVIPFLRVGECLTLNPAYFASFQYIAAAYLYRYRPVF